jgi:hypothetical protein
MHTTAIIGDAEPQFVGVVCVRFNAFQRNLSLLCPRMFVEIGELFLDQTIQGDVQRLVEILNVASYRQGEPGFREPLSPVVRAMFNIRRRQACTAQMTETTALQDSSASARLVWLIESASSLSVLKY